MDVLVHANSCDLEDAADALLFCLLVISGLIFWADEKVVPLFLR